MDQVKGAMQTDQGKVITRRFYIRSLVLVGVIMLGIGLAGGYLLCWNIYKRNNSMPNDSGQEMNTPSSSSYLPIPSVTQIPTITIQPEEKIISMNNVSPDGNYTVTEKIEGDYNTITVSDSKGTIIVSDLVKNNMNEIGMGKKFSCPCGVQFGGWINKNIFIINIPNSIGEEYEYEVNAATGKVDEMSLRRINFKK